MTSNLFEVWNLPASADEPIIKWKGGGAFYNRPLVELWEEKLYNGKSASDDLTGVTPDLVRNIEYIDYTSFPAGIGPNNVRAVYTGKFEVKIGFAGLWYFESDSDDNSRITVDGILITDNWACCKRKIAAKSCANGWHDIVVEYW